MLIILVTLAKATKPSATTSKRQTTDLGHPDGRITVAERGGGQQANNLAQ